MWNKFNGVIQCHNCGQIYHTPPSVEAMRIETLEKAAKVCEANAKEWMDGNNDWCRGQVTGSNDCAAAIRSMK